MKLYIRLARYTLEKGIIENFSDHFGLVIPANLLFYYRKSLAKYINKLSTPFFIDPTTYVFRYPKNMLKAENGQLEFDQDGQYKLKRSYEKQISFIDGDLFRFFRSDNPLPVSYFDDQANLENFVKKSIAYQEDLLSESLEKISRYESMLDSQSDTDSNLKPEFIVSPYFYFRNTSDPWYNVNLKLSQYTKELLPDKQVFSVLCMDKRLLGRTMADKIATDFSRSDGFLLFASDFKESTATVSQLRKMRQFVNRLFNETSRPICNLYGDFFSFLLNFYGLNCLSSGVCLLAKRDATDEYLTGRSYIRFYVPSLHEFISEEDLRTYLRRFDPIDECKCDLCQKLSEAKNTLDPAEYVRYIDRIFINSRGQLMKYTMEHFLHNKLSELELVNNQDLAEVKEIIEEERQNSDGYRRLLNPTNFIDRILTAI